MNNCLVSVIIPMYNIERYIERCIDSVLNQSYKNIEVICIDDGSNDNTSKIIERYVTIDNRIKYYFQKNSGVSSARNVGITNSKGKYIMFVDGDDYIEKNMISELLENINGSKLVVSRLSEYKGGNDIKLYLDNIKVLRDIILGEVDQTACGILYDLDFIKVNKIGFEENMKYGEDFIFTLDVILKANENLRIINKKFYNIELRTNSASREYSIDMADKISELCVQVRKRLEKSKLTLELKSEFSKFVERNLSMALTYIGRSAGCRIKKKNTFDKLKNQNIFIDNLPDKKTKKIVLFLNFPTEVFYIIDKLVQLRRKDESKKRSDF